MYLDEGDDGWLAAHVGVTDADPARASAAISAFETAFDDPSQLPEGGSLRELTAGIAIRQSRIDDRTLPGSRLQVPVLCVQYLVCSAPKTRAAALTMTTPNVALAGDFERLFDAIAGATAFRDSEGPP